MKIVDSRTIKGDGDFNQDVLGFSDESVWVIDGATDLFNEYSFCKDDPVSCYVNTLSLELSKYIDCKLSLKEILFKAINSTNIKLGLFPEEVKSYYLPSFAIAIFKVSGNKLYYLILGDCYLYLLNNDRASLITDTRISKFSSRNREIINQLKTEGIYSEEKVLEIYKQTRKLMNTPEGYWIGSPDAKGINHSKCGSLNKDNYNKLLMYTDGLMEAFDVFNIDCLDNSLFNKNKIEAILQKLKSKRYTNSVFEIVRPRRCDDITYILVEL